MHVAICLFTIFSVWRWGDWQNWRKYHATMFYIVAGGLLYEYLTKDHTLWSFHPDFLYNQQMTVIVYAFVTMPLSVLLFLSRFPQTIKKQLIYLTKWLLIYTIAEIILQYFGRISYQNGWSLFHSFLFDIMMFPMLIFHHKRPLLAYLVSIVIVVLLMHWFDVPMS